MAIPFSPPPSCAWCIKIVIEKHLNGKTLFAVENTCLCSIIWSLYLKQRLFSIIRSYMNFSPDGRLNGQSSVSLLELLLRRTPGSSEVNLAHSPYFIGDYLEWPLYIQRKIHPETLRACSSKHNEIFYGIW